MNGHETPDPAASAEAILGLMPDVFECYGRLLAKLDRATSASRPQHPERAVTGYEVEIRRSATPLRLAPALDPISPGGVADGTATGRAVLDELTRRFETANPRCSTCQGSGPLPVRGLSLSVAVVPRACPDCWPGLPAAARERPLW